MTRRPIKSLLHLVSIFSICASFLFMVTLYRPFLQNGITTTTPIVESPTFSLGTPPFMTMHTNSHFFPMDEREEESELVLEQIKFANQRNIVKPDRNVPKNRAVGRISKVPKKDFGPVVNPHPYKFVIDEPGVCSSSKTPIFLVTFVHTAPSHYKHRTTIRDTWGSPKLRSQLGTLTLFVMGQTRDYALQDAIEYESEHYHDILQENFLDSYHNLTYKAIGWLKWTRDNCPNARYVLKTDDDIFTNVFHLVNHLRSMEKYDVAPTRSFICLVWYRMQVYRNGKWGVPRAAFRPNYYPVYCSGSAYLLTQDIISDLFHVSQHIKFFWVDDVYITGMLPEKLGTVRHVSLESVYVFKSQDFDTRFFGSSGKNAGTGIFGHIGKRSIFYRLWNKILQKMGKSEMFESRISNETQATIRNIELLANGSGNFLNS